MKAVKSGVGGWLLVLCLLLLIGQPISLGLVASSMLDALASGGLSAVLILLTRLIVTGFGIAAGLALLGRRPGAVALARLSLALSAATDVFVYTTPFFPSNRAPGETPVYIVASLTYSTLWILYLWRSKRVRITYGCMLSATQDQQENLD